MSLLQWVKTAPEFPKFYLRSREGTEARAAWGTAPSTQFQVGGMAFFPTRSNKDSLWNSFPLVSFWTPKYARQEFSSFEPASTRLLNSAIKNSVSLPTQESWNQLIEQSLREIAKGSLEKVVLARRTTLQIEVDPFALLEQLQKKSRGAALFAVQFSPDAAFIGVTPERLYRRKGRKITIDALAGTALLHAETLLHSQKDLKEFSFVKDSIESSASPLCETWHWQEKDSIYTTSHLQHLYNCFTGILRENSTDLDLIQALHPTAALGGAPRKTALDYIAKQEPFDRGWYAAPLGFASAEEAEFVVGIRSALVTKEATHLFAGAGIVHGSIPSKEWDELDHKISLIQSELT